MKHKVALFAFMRKMLVKMSAVARLVTPVLINQKLSDVL